MVTIPPQNIIFLMLNKIIESGKATCKVLNTPDQWFGVTFKEDRECVVKKLSELTNEKVYPSPLFNKR